MTENENMIRKLFKKMQRTMAKIDQEATAGAFFFEQPGQGL
jgi:hypothetical protein